MYVAISNILWGTWKIRPVIGFVINTLDFIDMRRHHKKYVEKTCDYVCPNEKMCELHYEIQKMTDYLE